MDKQEHLERIEESVRKGHELNEKENVKITPEISQAIYGGVYLDEIAEIRADLDELRTMIDDAREEAKAAQSSANWAQYCQNNP